MESEIRKWRLSDAADLAAAINNKKVMDHLRDGLPYPYQEKDAVEYITAMLHMPADSGYAWAIAVQDKAVGSIGIFRKENIHRQTAEMGYYIAQEYWGRGIATKAVAAACQEVFEQTDIMRIFAEPFAYNTSSCRVLEKAGFTLEGVMRKNAVKNGKVLDMKLYARLREENTITD